MHPIDHNLSQSGQLGCKSSTITVPDEDSRPKRRKSKKDLEPSDDDDDDILDKFASSSFFEKSPQQVRKMNKSLVQGQIVTRNLKKCGQ